MPPLPAQMATAAAEAGVLLDHPDPVVETGPACAARQNFRARNADGALQPAEGPEALPTRHRFLKTLR